MKPILYHDIDGVLFGHYGPQGLYRLRPGLADWLAWATTHCELRWLTGWSTWAITDLLSSTNTHHFFDLTVVCPWTPPNDEGGELKSQYILRTTPPDSPWLWIDDEPLTENEHRCLHTRGLQDRFVCIPRQGENVLIRLPEMLGPHLTALNDGALAQRIRSPR